MSASDRAAITRDLRRGAVAEGFHRRRTSQLRLAVASRVVVGLGLEVNGLGIDAFNSTSGLAGTSLKSTSDWDVALYGRVGYAFDRFLPYVLVGAAWDHNKVSGK